MNNPNDIKYSYWVLTVFVILGAVTWYQNESTDAAVIFILGLAASGINTRNWSALSPTMRIVVSVLVLISVYLLVSVLLDRSILFNRLGI